MSRSCLTAALAAIALGAAAAAPAQIERQHGAHVHGEATGNLSQDGTALRLELEIPGVNLVGFEHPPRNDEQQQLLDDTLAFLNGGEWLLADARGGCQIERINAHTHGFDADYEHGKGHDHHHDEHQRGHNHHHDEHHHHGHAGEGRHDHHGHQAEHSHDHASHQHDDQHQHHHHSGHDHEHHGHSHHDHAHHDHEHAEFHIIAHLNCESPQALRWIEIGLFADYPGNELIAVDVLTDRAATRARLTPGNARIDLGR